MDERERLAAALEQLTEALSALDGRITPLLEFVSAQAAEDAEQFRDGYWSGPAACTPWPLSLVVFDSRVQHGRAVELIQRAACALGAELATDNAWGPLTRAAVLCAVEEHGAPAVCAAVIRERLYHYGRQDRSTRGLFRDGWIARMCALAAAASLYDGPDEGP